MARLAKQEHEYGKLSIESVSVGQVEIFYSPHEEAISMAKSFGSDIAEFRVKILEISEHSNSIVMYPFVPKSNSPKFLGQKYRKITAITLLDFDGSLPKDLFDVEEILSGFPKNRFVKDYDFGLGLIYEYRFFIDAIEELSDCTILRIGENLETGNNSDLPGVFDISYEEFMNATHDLSLISDRSSDAARKVKEIRMYNRFAKIFGKEELPMKLHRLPITKLLSRAAQDDIEIDEEDRDLILSSLSDYKEQIARSEPERLARLSDDVELVKLKVLIDKFSEMLQKQHEESKWQEFFNNNPFILSMALGYPIIKIQGQASLGGRNLSGSGVKITDFLVKNKLTNNTALFEIKRPQTPLLNQGRYRGLFTPHNELSGSIIQILNQKYHFEQEISQTKQNSKIYDMETYAVHCCLVIGMLPIDPDHQKSFEFIRGDSKGVQIITYDELKERLAQLYELLSNN